MAARQVADTVELLEAILLRLPAQDVLLSQRVTKHFKHVIDTSVPLQRKLFFQIDPPPTTTDRVQVTVNPLLVPPHTWHLSTSGRYSIRTLATKFSVLGSEAKFFSTREDGGGALGIYLEIRPSAGRPRAQGLRGNMYFTSPRTELNVCFAHFHGAPFRCFAGTFGELVRELDEAVEAGGLRLRRSLLALRKRTT